MIELRAAAGLARSVAIYYGRPDRIARMARFYSQFVQPGDVAFDIGAHVGNRSRALARAGARVVALEPQCLFHRFLKWTAPAGVETLRMAVGASSGMAELSVSKLHPTVSTLSPAALAGLGHSAGFQTVVWDAREMVEVTTIDALADRYGEPAFVKIDVEGSEAAVLAGLSRSVPTVAFEFLPGQSHAAMVCAKRLRELGDYEFNIVLGEGVHWHLKDWCDAAALQEALHDPVTCKRFGDVYARLRDHRAAAA